MRVRMMEEQKKDAQEFKGRQLGFSEKGGGLVLGWNYTFLDDSQNIIVGGVEHDAVATYNKAKNGLNYLRNTQFYHETSNNNEELVRSKFTGSEIRIVSAKDNLQCLSRFSPFWVWYEEIGKGTKGWSLGVSRYNKAAIETEGEKSGYQSFIGTAGEVDEGVYDLEQRHYNPNGYNLISFSSRIFDDPELDIPADERSSHFTGKHWYKFVDENGNPLFQKSIDVINKEIEALPLSERFIERTQNPVYVSHALIPSVEGFFGQDRIMVLNHRKRLLQSKRELQIVRQGILKWKDAHNPYAGVEFIPDENGWIKIAEEPEVDDKETVYANLYYAGADSYDQDEARTSKSKGAFYIRKSYLKESKTGLYRCYVAQIVERPSVSEGGAERFYEHCAMACIFFRAMVNIEYSNLRIFQWLEDHNFEALLMPGVVMRNP